MVERSPFGVRLSRLLSARRPTFDWTGEYTRAKLARDAGVDSFELRTVFNGAEPSPEILGKLGPVLGIRAADMFAIAGLPVPPHLASAWPTRPWNVGSILGWALRMDRDQLGRLDELVRSLPVLPHTDAAPPDDYPEGPGALLLRLLRNRNIRPYNPVILRAVGGGPWVSASTMAMLGPGEVVITPQYVTAFAHLLGYTPEDMVALAGVGPVLEDQPVHPASAELAALAWNARRLSSDQLVQVIEAVVQTLRSRPV